jgi:hypothetical protein
MSVRYPVPQQSRPRTGLPGTWNTSLTTAGGVDGTVAYTNANDTSTASGTTTIVGTLARTNANDTSTASGTTTVVGSLARTNANDASAASGTTTVAGTLARSNANDTSAASGVAGAITGTVNATNADDTATTSSPQSAGGGGKPRKRYQIRLGNQILEGSKAEVEALARDIAIREAKDAAVPPVVEVLVPGKKRKPAITAATQVAADVAAVYRKALAETVENEDDEEALLALLT